MVVIKEKNFFLYLPGKNDFLNKKVPYTFLKKQVFLKKKTKFHSSLKKKNKIK